MAREESLLSQGTGRDSINRELLSENSFLTREFSVGSHANYNGPVKEISTIESNENLNAQMTEEEKKKRLEEMEADRLREQQAEHALKQTHAIFEALRSQTKEIELNVASGEIEVLEKEEMAFLMREHHLLLSNLKQQHVFLY
jgi:sucrose-6-phosphate hydrolase SacC (GH32 family)